MIFSGIVATAGQTCIKAVDGFCVEHAMDASRVALVVTVA